MPSFRSFHQAQQGQMAISFVVVLFFFIVLGFMVVDVGIAYGQRREIQSAVDLAALAGVAELPDDPFAAQTVALDYLRANGVDPADPDVTVTFTNPTPNQLEMTVSAPSGTFFSSLFGTTALDTVGARAVAEHQQGIVGGGGPAPPIPVSETLPPATPVIDGLIPPSDGYSKLGDLFGGSTDYGDVLVARDGTSISFAAVLEAPGGNVANDNVYYPRAKDNGGVDQHAVYNTGWNKHDFKALRNSDRAHFQVSCDGVAIHDFEQDYLRPDGAGWASDAAGNGQIVTAGPAQSASSLEWNLENPTLTGWGDDPGEDPLLFSPPFSPTYPNYLSEYDGWEWRMIYEFSIPEAAYAACVGSVEFTLAPIIGEPPGSVGGLHSSPGKTAEGEFLQAAGVEEAVWLVE
jgi:Flp pilus assembly protein TadG